MKNTSTVLYICLILFISVLFSCNSGFTVNEEDFRGVASFEIPELDEPTGTNVFTANFSIVDCTATTQLEEHGSTNYVGISNIVDEKTKLTLSLKLDGLVTGDYSNVKVTAIYTSLTSDSETLVERIQFDRYGEMVFEANTGGTSYDPSSATIVIDLNTAHKPQLGYITFNFESAQSVYDQSKSTQSYTLYVSAEDEEVIPYVSFVSAEAVEQDNNVSIEGFTSRGFTATQTNDLHIPASKISQNIQVHLLNVVPEYPVSIRLANSSVQGGVELLQTESTDGKFTFTLHYAAETNKIKTTENEYVFEITDTSGYYTGLSEPLCITVNSVRTYPKNDLADLKGTFGTNGNASPWSWRMHYRIREEDNNHVRKTAERNSGANVTSSEYKWGGFLGIGQKKTTEQLTKTESNQAIFVNSINQSPGGDGSKNGTGDIRTSAGWLYSDIITLYPDIVYRITANVVAGVSSSSDRDSGGDRVRMYLVPVTNTANTFTLSNAGGTALISVNGGEATKQPYLDLANGNTNNVNTVFSCNETTKMRLVFEKGQLDWGNANNSKMAGQEVKISNVILDYVYE